MGFTSTTPIADDHFCRIRQGDTTEHPPVHLDVDREKTLPILVLPPIQGTMQLGH